MNLSFFRLVVVMGVAVAQPRCTMNQEPQLVGSCISFELCERQDDIYTFADSTPLCMGDNVCCHAKVPCDFGGGVKGICRLQNKCEADWPGDRQPWVANKCVGPDNVRCCRAKCQLAYGPWSGACAACPGASETRSVDVKDTQGFPMQLCLEQAVTKRPCTLPCPATTTTITTTTPTTTTTTTAAATAAATAPTTTITTGTAAAQTLPPVDTAVVASTTNRPPPPAVPTTATATATTADAGSTAAPAGLVGGVEPWVIGVAAGGGVLVLICVVLAIVCLVRKKRSAFHSDRDDNQAIGLRTSTYASPAIANNGEYNAAPLITGTALYDQVPPEESQIATAVAATTAAYTNEGLMREQQTQIVYDASMPLTAGANVAGNRFSVAPKF